MRRLRFLVLALIGLLPLAAAAQDAAMLIADRVFLDGRETVVAEGRVEALRDGVRLQTRRIVYHQGSGRLEITGRSR